ncbi:hypothetical protein E3H11_17055 [Bradyrhizobium brasilense]|uniref:hypothetical protein n=1 Tax=Bradyrhizobium brasilense TaxID=1419277 RepID=UPI001456C870|nr:hypothetical protein [Bradyrhizobium brasilense]MCP1907981.1 putative coiled-coil protein SlyX [Bradyrhizobium elkanii]NLS70599.1 hypothetical protein [Bradyrhizobium brasilense]
MDNDSDQAWHGHAPNSPLPAGRRRWLWFLLIVVVALVGAGSVYAWPEVAALVAAISHESSGGATTSDKEALPTLLAAQQKLEEDLAALDRSVADGQAQLKAITDQLAALTSKVEELQHLPPPAAPPPPVTAEVPRAPIAPTTPQPRKPPPRAARPSGPVSIGGAPLNAAPGSMAR